MLLPRGCFPALDGYPAEGVFRDGGFPHRGGPQHCAGAAHLGGVPRKGERAVLDARHCAGRLLWHVPRPVCVLRSGVGPDDCRAAGALNRRRGTREHDDRGDSEDRRATLFKRCGFKYSDSGDAESAAELLPGSGEPGGIRLRFTLPHPHAFGHGRSRGGIPELPADYGEHPRRGFGRVCGCAA